MNLVQQSAHRSQVHARQIQEQMKELIRVVATTSTQTLEQSAYAATKVGIQLASLPAPEREDRPLEVDPEQELENLQPLPVSML